MTKRTFQVKLDGIGAALYEAVDGADALRQFFADNARGERNGSLTITENHNGYACGRIDNEDFVEAVAVSDQATAEQ